MKEAVAAVARASATRERDPGRTQPGPVVGASTLVLIGTAWLGNRYGMHHASLFVVGAACGLVLYHAAFGFTTAFRALVTAGDGRRFRAQLLMLAVATVLFAPMLALGEVMGTPVQGAVAPVGLAVFVGAFVFAVGMQLGGGCGSGTLFHLGGGATSMLTTLTGFIAGSVLATFHMPFWWAAPSFGEVSLARALGWPMAVASQLAVFALVAAVTWWGERGRFYPGSPGTKRSGWSRLVHGPWPLAAGAVGLAVLNAITLALAGHPWGITWAFALWGAKAMQLVGYDLSTVPFWSGEFQQAALSAPVLADVTSVMDIGLVLGAALAAGLAGRFGARRRVGAAGVAAAILGGLLLGYGSRIAFGCNIGAYFGGIASTSLHGWLWGIAAILGTPVGVNLRRGFGLGEPARSANAER
jgi:uncharacterized membrane protein YedE/YeeE